MRHLNEYMDSLKGKRIAVLGLGVSNQPLVRLLLSHGLNVTACDKTASPEKLALGELGAELHLGEDYLEGLDADIIFRTPGMRPDLPQLEKAIANGAVLTSEMEAFFEVCPCKIIAVTGSDGKTTTTTLISELLKAAGKKVWVGGNIGTPLLDRAAEMTEEDVAVLDGVAGLLHIDEVGKQIVGCEGFDLKRLLGACSRELKRERNQIV